MTTLSSTMTDRETSSIAVGSMIQFRGSRCPRVSLISRSDSRTIWALTRSFCQLRTRSACMACDRLKTLWHDQEGAVILEFTVTMLVFMTVLFGTLEFGYAYYQWNVATKAVQLGGRLAAVSNPVASNLLTLTGLE